MSNTPPPFNEISGITRSIMKDNPASLAEYNGNARPGELVVDLEVVPPVLYIGDTDGGLTQVGSSGGGGSGGNQLGDDANFVRVIAETGEGGVQGVYLRGEAVQGQYFYYNGASDFTDATWFEDNGSYFVQFTASIPQIVDTFWDLGDNDLNRLILYTDDSSYTLTDAGWQENVTGDTYTVQVNEAPPTSPLALANIEFLIFKTFSSTIELANRDIELRSDDDITLQAGDDINVRAVNDVILTSDDDNFAYSWVLQRNGMVMFPQGGIFAVSNVPPSASLGSPGDKAGTVAFDANYIYYCTADYADGQTDIWRRSEWTDTQW